LCTSFSLRLFEQESCQCLCAFSCAASGTDMQKKAMSLLSSYKDDKAQAQSPLKADQILHNEHFGHDGSDNLLVASPIIMFSPLSYKNVPVANSRPALRERGIEVLKLNRRSKWQFASLAFRGKWHG
jgi:hypothetical protein